MDELPGLTKKQKTVLLAAGVDTPAKLRSRMLGGRLPAALPALNPATRAFLEHKPKRRATLAQVDALAARLRENLKVRGKGRLAASRVVLVGSGRRRRPTVKDIDVLIVAPDSWRGVDVLERVDLKHGTRSVRILASYAAGPRRRSLIVATGRPRTAYRVDLFLAWESEKPFALFHHTGSWRYNVRVRAHAKNRGWKLNQYGLFVRGGPPDQRVPGSGKIKTEGDLARFLGVTPRPPHLREQ